MYTFLKDQRTHEAPQLLMLYLYSDSPIIYAMSLF